MLDVMEAQDNPALKDLLDRPEPQETPVAMEVPEFREDPDDREQVWNWCSRTILPCFILKLGRITKYSHMNSVV